MLNYLIKRFLSTIPILLGITLIIFVALQLAPGDAAQIILGPMATAEDIAATNAKWGLDQPIAVQYMKWLGNALHGDFGMSFNYKQQVFPLVLQKLVPTLYLALGALLIAIPFGILFGILSAIYENKWIDKIFSVLSYLGISFPIFWLGLILIIIFGQSLHWFPTSGMYSPGSDSFTDMLKHLVLPSITLAMVPLAVIVRITKSSMLEVMEQQYMKTALAKGCKRNRRIYVHGLKNAFVPILTILGVEFGYVIGGALVVENVFSWPGLGSLILTATTNRDYPVVLCGTLVICFWYVMVNFVVDLLYGVFDPRIKYE